MAACTGSKCAGKIDMPNIVKNNTFITVTKMDAKMSNSILPEYVTYVVKLQFYLRVKTAQMQLKTAHIFLCLLGPFIPVHLLQYKP